MADLFTDEQLKQLAEMLKPMITEVATKEAAAHVTKRNESFEKKWEGKIQTPVPAKDEEQDQEKLTLTQKVLRQEEDNKKLRQEIKAKEQAGHQKDMRSRLEAKLLKDGIPAHQIKAVAAQLIYEDKLVGTDSEGNATFKGYDGETVDLEEGLSNWMKDEGKVFIPAANPRGANQRTIKGRSNNTPNGFANEADRDDALDSLIRGMR